MTQECDAMRCDASGLDIAAAATAATSSPMLPGEFHIRMTHAIVPGKRIRSAECLLLGAQITVNLLLASIVNRILVTCQVVRSGEYRIARLSGTRVDPFAFVRSGLAVE